MPANLSPQYKEAERKYQSARDNQERLTCLREMLALIPKHKGTEKLQAEIKSKISKLTHEIQEGKKSKAHRHTFHIDRIPNVPQVLLLGYPNVGKSQIICSLTNAKSEVTPYPFATRYPIPGIMLYQDIKIELIDSTSVTRDYMEPWIPDIIRGVDAVIIVCDLGDKNVLDQIQDVIDRIEKIKILLVGRHIVSQISEESAGLAKRTLILGNKSDLDVRGYNEKLIIELFGKEYDYVSISALNQTNLEIFKQTLYTGLELVRVYTKVPGHKPDLENPFLLPKGSTVLDLAQLIHNEMAERFKTARIWGSTRFEGQHVEKHYLLQDKDIVEIHV
ncbi:MAG: TGS domain-containing protein [bacterium]|nr:TGS domain-containing protein [bacterium]